MLKKLFWNCVIGAAHLIPAGFYKSEALNYLRYRRDFPKRPTDGPKAIPTEPPEVIPPTQKFIDHGPGDRAYKRRNGSE